MRVPTAARPSPPTDILKEMLVGRPAWTKKYVGVPPIAEPQKGCAEKTMQTISVRRRSTPLKQSQYEVPSSRSFSRAFVWIIMASVCFTLAFSAPDSRRRRLRFGFLVVAFADQMPRGFWCEEEHDKQRDRPGPLNSKPE